MSVGIASYPENADTIGTLLYAVDEVLYAIKTNEWACLPLPSPDRRTNSNPQP